MSGELLLYLAMGVPVLAAALIPLFGKWPNLRESVTLAATFALFAVTAMLLADVMGGGRPQTPALEVGAGLTLQLAVEPLGMLFAAVASTLWIVNSIYSIGYMRGNDEPRQTPFYVCFAVAIASTMVIAYSANLFTLFIGYEVLTLSTYPLVTHKGTEEAKRAGRVYLLMLLGSSMLLLLPAILGTWALAGTVTFTPGGVLPEGLAPAAIGILLGLFAFGVGKAAIMPMHFWLPRAMVAPTPVSALLHAVAVVKAGVFTLLKVAIYIFGLDTLAASGQGEWLVYIASATVLLASLIAMTKDNLKARLAYSTISQLSYVVLGASLATGTAMLGGGLQIAMHAAGKITLFFCAGAIYTAAHKTEISDMRGLGRAMPFTFAAFMIGALSIIGLPPMGGMWSKWYLALGALEADQLLVVAVLMISSLLNVAYLLPIPIRAFMGGDNARDGNVKIKEAPLPCLIAIGFTALACIVLFFFPGPLFDLLGQIPVR